MSNKQVIAIFIIGVGLLLGAFWAGLYVVKQDTAANTNQSGAAARGAQSAAGKQSSGNADTPGQAGDNSSQYVVFVASFGTLEKAKQLEAELQKLNYRSAFVQMPSSQDTLYRVNIGPYDKADAEKVATMLSNERRGIMIFPWKANP
ncbi:MAG TPA: SPOR domain-containing protein [Blastocatellia bacterium]|nr:SPOR domain-containing protein [Blastocatellia bacterium]